MKNNMKTIGVIVPVHKFDDNLRKTFTRAIESVPDEEYIKLFVVGPVEVVKECAGLEGAKQGKVNYIVNRGETDFISQVLLAVNECKTDFFSILEADDEYKKIWFKNVQEHIESLVDVSIFLPLTEVYDLSSEKEIPVGFANEIALSPSYSKEDAIGYLTVDGLMTYSDFNLTGAVIKTSDFIDCGGLKKSIPLAFWFEFLLRMIYNGKKAYVIPKMGYKHGLNRADSLMLAYKDIPKEEAQKYFNIAKQEYFFKKERERKN